MTLGARFLDACQRFGDRPAAHDARASVAYRELAALAGGFARALDEAKAPARVGVALPPSIPFLGAFFGAVVSGRVPILLNLLLEPDLLAAFLRKAGTDVVITSPALPLPFSSAPWRGIDAGAVRPAPPSPAPGLPEDAPAVILLTSGTTGQTKGVPLTHENLLSNADACAEVVEFTEGHVLLGLIPLFHSFGLIGSGLLPILHGAQSVVLERFSPAGVGLALARHRPTALFAVASMHRALLRGGQRPPGTDRLRVCVSGGEPLEPAVEGRFREVFGVPLLNGYGLTETSPVISVNPPSAPKPGTVGPPLRGVRVRLGDAIDAGAGGTVGEIEVLGPNVMRGYFEDPAATAAVFTADGWFKTGDLGGMDKDGYLRITGRSKDLIISGGENILPSEIEAVLAEHPAVAEAAVVGARDPARGEVPVAFVILRAGAAAAPEAILGFARERLLRHRAPREVRVVRDLPRGPTGKVLKRALREEVGVGAPAG